MPLVPHAFDANRHRNGCNRCCSWFFFVQYFGLVKKGYYNPIQEEDAFALPSYEASKSATARFQTARDQLNSTKDRLKWTPLWYLFRSLWTAFGSEWLWCIVWIFGYCFTYTLQPLLIRAILRYLENGFVDGLFTGCPPWSLPVLLSLDTMLMSLTMQHGWAAEICAAMALRVALMDTILKKSMKLSTSSRSSTTAGQLITILSVDIDRIFNMVLFLQWGLLAPTLIIIVCSLIVREIGWLPALISFIILFLLAVLQGRMAIYLRKVRAEMTKYTDRRIGLINEVLHGIRVIKAYAWEPAAAKSVQTAREKELKQLTWLLIFIAVNYCVMFFTPVVVGLVAFVLYAYYGNVLTVSVVFTTFATINLLRLPIKIVPMMAMRAVDAVVAMKRLARILDLDERPARVLYDEKDDTLGSICLKNASFSWSGTTSDLKHISLDVEPGKLVCIVGRVAAGKTSLISALLGEIEQTEGTKNVKSNAQKLAQKACSERNCNKHL